MKNYSSPDGKYRVDVGNDGSIRVRPGDAISKYSAAIYGNATKHWDHFGRLRNGAPEPLPNPNDVRAGETLYHIPTYLGAKKNGASDSANASKKYGQSGINVAKLDDADRIGEALQRSLPHLSPAAREEVEKLLDPTTLKIVAGVIAAWIVSHLIGIGEIVDIILLVVGIAAIGLAIFEGVEELYHFGDKALNAKTERDLDIAGKHFANAIAILGTQAVLAVLFRGAPKTFKGKRPDVGTPLKGPIPRTIRRDANLPAGAGETSWWGRITISPHGVAADRRLVAMHEKVHQLLTPRFNVLRKFRVEGRAASYIKSPLSRYIEEAIAESVAQMGVNGFKAAFSGVTFPVRNGYVTVFRKSGDILPVVPEFVGLVVGGFFVGDMQFVIKLSNTSPCPLQIAAPSVH